MLRNSVTKKSPCKRAWRLHTAVLALAALTTPLFGSVAKRPNFVIIFTDDHDLDEIGCYDGKMPTPHMDSLARDGAQFTRYYVSSPVCSPARYSALSGRYASRSERIRDRFPISGQVNLGWNAGVINEPHTLASVLQRAGYVTGMCGKWHQGLVAPTTKFNPDADSADAAVQKQLAHNYDAAVRTVKSCGFDFADAIYSQNADDGGKEVWLPKQLAVHNMEWVTSAACSFIEKNRDEPFLLYLAPTLPHSPAAIPSLKADVRNTPRGLVDFPNPLPSRASVLERARAAVARNPGLHLDMAAAAIWLDDGVGAVLAKLDELGLAENTLVLLASDNGNIAKFTCYDGGGRLPFLARWKGVVPAGVKSDALVSNVDFAPTVFDFAGVSPPEEMIVDGRSIRKALASDPSYRRESLFLEITMERAVVTDDGYKYIAVRYPPEMQRLVDEGVRHNHWGQPMGQDTHTYDVDKHFPSYFDRDQLFHLPSDPSEQRNLASDPSHAAALDRCKAMVKEYSRSLPHTYGEFTADR